MVLTRASQIGLRLRWIYEAEHSCFAKRERASGSASHHEAALDEELLPVQKLLLHGVMASIHKTLQQIADFGLPAVSGRQWPQSESESPFHYPEIEEDIQRLKGASYEDRIKFLDSFADKLRAAGKFTILHAAQMHHLVEVAHKHFRAPCEKSISLSAERISLSAVA